MGAITDRVRVVPIAMVRPNSQGIYAPSRIGQPFLTDPRNIGAIRNYSRTILVSFERDGVSNPQPVTAYGYGFSGWYIVVEG
jgi:hypothetical protein